MSVGLVVGNRYELTARVGRGGFGSVWQARDPTLGRDVAVKLLEVAPEDRDIIARFRREAQALASMTHPNIVMAYDFGVTDDSAYLVMELIAGGSLADELATRRMAGLPPFDVPRVVALGRQIAAGLAAAHGAGLVHRDLKPANLMVVRATGAIKIVDFGIAHVRDLSRLTKPGGYLGTMPYASPEQMADGPVDGRSDLYSLGCLLYELLTDRSPYIAESPAQWVAAHQSATPTPIRTYLPTIPAELESLIVALLAKDPARRPSDADAVGQWLQRVPLSGSESAVPQPRPTLVDSRLVSGAPPVSPAAVAPQSPAYVPGRAGSSTPGQFVGPAGPAPAGWPYAAQGPQAAAPRRPMPAGSASAPPGQPYYAWTQVPTPQGWMAVPHLMNPQALARPGTVTAAGRILRALAIACGIEALIMVAATVKVGQAVGNAFDGVVSTSGGQIVGVMMFAVVIYAVSAAITGVLAGATMRGSHVGRIWTLIVAPLTLLWLLSAVGSKDVATLAATPTPDDAGRPRVLTALARVRAAVPGWYVSLSRLFEVFAILSLIAVIVLVVVPPSNAYFRARRRRGMR